METFLAKAPGTKPFTQPGGAGRFARTWTELVAWNPKPGVFLNELAGLLESRRRFDAAEVCYRRAIAVAPQLAEAKSGLGMLLMRVGKINEAHPILDEAFQADPFHMRVSNFRKVLKLLDGYQMITTEHFVIRVDSKLDKLLGGYMAEYLESIYPELVAQFGFAPPQRTQFEIYNNSEGTTGHEWFSADGRHALDSNHRRLHRRDGGNGLAHGRPHAIQLGARTQARVCPRDHRAANGL